MGKQAIAQFKLEDGTEIYVKVPEPSDGTAVEEAALEDEVYKVLDGATGTFERAIDKIQPVANTLISRLKGGLTTPANEVEVKFGFNVTVEAGVVFSSAGGEACFEVTLKWHKD